MGAHEITANYTVGTLFLKSGIIAALLIYLFSRPAKRELVFTGAVAVAILGWFGLGSGPLYIQAMRALSYGAAAAYLSMFIKVAISKGRGALWVLGTMCVIPLAVAVHIPMHKVMASWTQQTLDYGVYLWETSYGYPPSFALGALVQNHAWLNIVSECAYVNLPIAMTLLWLLLREDSEAGARRLVICAFLMAGTGFVLYYFCPAVGTIGTFGEAFPGNPPPPPVGAGWPTIPPSFPRNNVPSLHTSWTLALLWFARRRPAKEQIAWMVYGVFTLIYTLAGGGHYLVDMVASLPFAIANYFVSRKAEWPAQSRIPQAVTLCGAVYVAWILLIRFGAPDQGLSPVVPWTLSALSVALGAIAVVWFHSVVEPKPAEPAREWLGAPDASFERGSQN